MVRQITEVYAGNPISAERENTKVSLLNALVGVRGAGGITASIQGGNLTIAQVQEMGADFLGQEFLFRNDDPDEDDMEMGYVVAIEDLYGVINPTKNLDVMPSAAKYSTDNESSAIFGIVTEPAGYEKSGRIRCLGLVYAQAKREEQPTDKTDPWAEPMRGAVVEDGEFVLKLQESGGDFEVLGEENLGATGDYTEAHWVVIRIGGAGGGGASLNVYEATDDPSGGEVTVEGLNLDGSLDGNEQTFNLLPS